MLHMHVAAQQAGTQRTLRNSVNEISSHVELSKCQLVMIAVIQYIQKISIKRMNIIYFWKVF